MHRLLLLLLCTMLQPLSAGAAEPPPTLPDLTISITGPAAELTRQPKPPDPPPAPESPPLEIEILSPTVVDACSLQQGRTAIVKGRFPKEVRVLLDGAVIPVETTGEGEATFILPPLEGGMHQVQLATDERKSLPHALFVDFVPKIAAVSIGEDQVTAYEIIVRGENFYAGSSLLVDGKIVTSLREGELSFSALPLLGGEDFLRYVDCTTLLYIRHPVTREENRRTLRVVNANGEQSAPYVIDLP